jgi:hypothetical protein
MEKSEFLGTCGIEIEGSGNTPVTKREFNRWVARVLRYHLVPMKSDMSLCKEALYGSPDHPNKGLINVRDWICRSAAVSGAIIGAIIAFALAIVPIVKWIGDVRGWW